MSEKCNNIHPVWKTVHVAVVMGIVTTFLWATADSFDSTEYMAMMGVLVSLIIYAFGGDGAKILMRKLGNGKENHK